MRIRLLTSLLLLQCAVFAQETILPPTFSGWQKAPGKAHKDARGVNPANADVLKEYTFKDAEQATYTREGRTITLRASRFNDGTGAFGAFTFYREPQMVGEKLCDQAASAREHIVFR